MEPSESIRRFGFRRWYERQLIEGHAWFVTCFLCLVAVAACLEAVSFRDSPASALALVAAVFAAGWIGIYALGRYKAIMVEVERLADHSTCGACGEYGRFLVVEALRGLPMPVRCRRCGNEWRID